MKISVVSENVTCLAINPLLTVKNALIYDPLSLENSHTFDCIWYVCQSQPPGILRKTDSVSVTHADISCQTKTNAKRKNSNHFKAGDEWWVLLGQQLAEGCAK